MEPNLFFMLFGGSFRLLVFGDLLLLLSLFIWTSCMALFAFYLFAFMPCVLSFKMLSFLLSLEL